MLNLLFFSSFFGLMGFFFFFFDLNVVFLFFWNLKILIHELKFYFIIDYMSLIFFIVLLLIVSSVFCFGYFYLGSDLFNGRFFFLMIFFVFSMIILIFCPFMFFCLVGYDGLGVVSFLLVVYYKSSQSWMSGLKTFFINRLGDGLFIWGIMMFLFSGEFNYKMSLSLTFGMSLLFLLAWFTKSAQFPFSSWLPAAMAAPTPVSALVHSSTLVTAGVYLLIRLSFSLSFYLLDLCMLLGLLTLFISSFCAMTEWDSKKIIAFSTLSQLGLMIYSYGLGLYGFCFFHLMSHAIFKALMFMIVGYLMLKNFHFQDLRHLSNLYQWKNFLFMVLLVCIFSLSGFPFLIGFFSKDLMLDKFFYLNFLIFFFFLLSLMLTGVYGGRLISYLWWKSFFKKKISIITYKFLIMSILILWIFICFYGKIHSFMYLSMSFMGFIEKIFVFSFIIVGLFLGLNKILPLKGSILFLFKNIFFINILNTKFFVQYLKKMGIFFICNLDQGLLTKMMSFFRFSYFSNFMNTQFIYFFDLKFLFWLILMFIFLNSFFLF